MGLRRGLIGLVAGVLSVAIAACGAPTIEPSPSPTPTPRPTLTREPVTPAAPSPTPAAAQLAITGSGAVYCFPSNACEPVMVFAPVPARSLFELGVDDVQVRFDQWLPGEQITGKVSEAPATLAAGSWAVGIGKVETEDSGSCDSPCTSPFFPSSLDFVCVREISVPEDTRSVRIQADFDECAIDVELEPQPPEVPQRELVVPSWTPPDRGILDDCRYRRTLLRIDGDGRPWYEVIETGERIETVEYEGWRARLGDQRAIVSPEGYAVPEWRIGELQCVFGSAGVGWVGGSYEAWDGWDRALGEIPAAVARSVLEHDRGHFGGPPPGAVSLAAAEYEHVDGAILRALDEEFRSGGGDRWSERHPEFYLGAQHRLTNAIDTRGGIGFRTERWGIVEDPVTRWRAYQIREFETPRGRTVSVLDRPMAVWDDCAELIVPSAAPGEPDVTVESSIDSDGGVVAARFSTAEGKETLVIVEYQDATCSSHPVMGPIIEDLLP